MHTTPQNDVIESLAVGTSLTASRSVSLRGYNGGLISVPAGSSITSIKYYISPTETGTYLPLYSGGSQISTTVAAERVFALDSAIKGAAFLKLKGDATGSVDLHLTSS
jgi:hypothetical protein